FRRIPITAPRWRHYLTTHRTGRAAQGDVHGVHRLFAKRHEAADRWPKRLRSCPRYGTNRSRAGGAPGVLMDNASTAQRWPRVSFAMPVLNAGALLEDALKTIRAQDYPDVEIVVADGMSTDNTRAICRKYNCVIVDNLRVEAEIGVELARQRATGEFVFVMAA